MRAGDVPSNEMRRRRSARDEAVEAVLRGETPPGRDELAHVADFVAEMRASYGEAPPARSPELAAFMETPLTAPDDVPVPALAAAGGSWQDRAMRRSSRMLSTVTAFLATVTGKVVIGGAVAAASVGGLHATEVVDVPGLPDQATQVELEATGENDDEEGGEEAATSDQEALPEEAVAGQETAEAKRDAAAAYTAAMQEWADCVAENAAAQGDESTRTTGEFDPRAECGERPRPEEFGLTEPPSQADEGRERAEEGRSRGESGQPEDTPSGQPEDTPDGQPESTPDGRPEDTPDGRPDDTSDGRPENTPSGQPENTPDGADQDGSGDTSGGDESEPAGAGEDRNPTGNGR